MHLSIVGVSLDDKGLYILRDGGIQNKAVQN
jgi:hypothetical protein